MTAIVCEATGRAEGKGGFFRRRKKKPGSKREWEWSGEGWGGQDST